VRVAPISEAAFVGAAVAALMAGLRPVAKIMLVDFVPELVVIVPSTPADAASLMLASLDYGRPVAFLEHELFGGPLLEAVGKGGQEIASFDVLEVEVYGVERRIWEPVPIGQVAVRRQVAT
jgi:pyruvate/2-oxoglutarate/acetoin dehydrogenase E1 component